MKRMEVREIGALMAFAGTYPTVATYDFIDVEELTRGDSDPVYVTLEIAEEGRISANGLLYDEYLVGAIESQLNDADAWRGHLGFFNSDEYPESEIYWVGSLREGQSLWAKGYIPPGQTREDIRRKKAKGQKVGTSIYGYGEAEFMDDEMSMYRLKNFELVSVDLVHSKRAALRTSQAFALTSETAHIEPQQKEQDEMPTREEVIQSLTLSEIPQNLREQIAREAVNPVQTELSAAQTRLTETETALSEALQLVGNFQQAAFETALSQAVAECTSQWQVTTEQGKARVAQLHSMIRNAALLHLNGATDAEKVGEAVKQAWEAHKLIAESVQLAISGPPAAVPPKAKVEATAEQGGNPLAKYKTAEGMAELMARFGQTAQNGSGHTH